MTHIFHIIIIIAGIISLLFSHVFGVDWRVKNGSEATVGQFPWMVSLTICSASLVDEYTVLSAGHCFCKWPINWIIAGALVIQNRTEPARQVVKIKSVHMHPRYSCGKGVTPYDAAIVKLEQPVQFNDAVQPVRLLCNASELAQPGDPVLVMGYGTADDGKMGTLRYGSNKVASCGGQGDYVCVSRQGAHIFNGDSGGPLIQRRADGSYRQLGVCSGLGSVAAYVNTVNICGWVQTFLNSTRPA